MPKGHKAANPTAGPKEISEALSKSGVDVTPAFVSTMLSLAKKKGGKAKRGRKVAVPVNNLQQLIQAKKLVEQLGGVAKTREAVNVLARIMG
ncbi:MAG: hypothetical protein U1A77_00335 [Pirellulales bacterium]